MKCKDEEAKFETNQWDDLKQKQQNPAILLWTTSKGMEQAGALYKQPSKMVQLQCRFWLHLNQIRAMEWTQGCPTARSKLEWQGG